MPVQPLRKGHDRNPRTAEEAEALVKQVESLFMPWNIDALVGGFTDDCVVRFGMVPEFRGREALRAIFVARSGKQRGTRQFLAKLSLSVIACRYRKRCRPPRLAWRGGSIA
jgi:hypothetical protein